MKLGELFAGYGGLGLAVEEVFGAELAWVSEWEHAPSKILAHHWPNVPNYGDVTKIDWANIEPVDIISGGSPCQDLSLAGKRRGMQDGTRSNLWESMREGIAIIRPKYVVWENVRGALSAEAVSASDMGHGTGFLGERDGHLRALGRVLGDLADLGFDAEWRGLRAADVGAPHGRFRIFILAANRDHVGSDRAGQWAEQNRRGQLANGGDSAPQPASIGGREGWAEHARQQGRPDAIKRSASTDWGVYEPAVRRWEAMRGTAPAAVELNAKSNPRLSPRFAEWMMGLPDGWVTDPAIGLTRNDQLKACGNGVVPQQAIAALSDMLAAFQEEEIAA
ncbi:MAG: DNA (cytosine-5-)-methyltransferase [Mycobacterium sp.]